VLRCVSHQGLREPPSLSDLYREEDSSHTCLADSLLDASGNESFWTIPSNHTTETATVTDPDQEARGCAGSNMGAKEPKEPARRSKTKQPDG